MAHRRFSASVLLDQRLGLRDHAAGADLHRDGPGRAPPSCSSHLAQSGRLGRLLGGQATSSYGTPRHKASAPRNEDAARSWSLIAARCRAVSAAGSRRERRRTRHRPVATHNSIRRSRSGRARALAQPADRDLHLLAPRRRNIHAPDRVGDLAGLDGPAPSHRERGQAGSLTRTDVRARHQERAEHLDLHTIIVGRGPRPVNDGVSSGYWMDTAAT